MTFMEGNGNLQDSVSYKAETNEHFNNIEEPTICTYLQLVPLLLCQRRQQFVVIQAHLV